MTRFTRRDFDTEHDLATGQLHKFVLKELHGHVLEVSSVHFHFDSAVLLPNLTPPPAPAPDAAPPPAEEASADGEDEGPSETDLAVPGLAVLRAIYLQAEEHPAQKILITGHTDTSGGAAYNVTLAHQRAMSLKHALLGERDEWVAIAHAKHRVEDYQQILTWVSKVWAADCDPEGIDNIHGSRTTRAVRNFQALYNEEFEAEITVDGVVGPQTWGAIFDVYMEVLADILDVDVDQLPAERARLSFVDAGKPGVGCGEHFPIDLPGVDGRRSGLNRRVQVLFFDPGEEPLLDCHPAADQCRPDDCEIYRKRHHFFFPIDVAPVPLLPRYRLEVELGDIDKLFTPIVAETHTDPGVRERLQAVGFLYSPLTHADIADRAEHAWAHFKKVYEKSDDASAVAHLRDRVEQLIVDGKALPPKGELKKLRVPGAYCVTPAQMAAGFFGTNAAGHRYREESSVWRDNDSIGRVPILGKLEAKFRRGWRPAGGVSLHFQLDTPDPIPAGHACAREPLRQATTTSTNDNAAPPPATVTFTMTGHPHGYVDAQLTSKPPSDPLADNVHKDFGGKRGDVVRGVDPVTNLFEVGNRRTYFEGELDYADPSASNHAHAVKAVTNDRGEAVAIFMPSFMGGDRYKLRVFVDPLRGRPSNGRVKPAVVKETGTLVVWRIFRISKYLRWPYPAGTTAQQKARCYGDLDDFDMAAIATEYKKAWLEVELEPEARAPTNLTAADHLGAIQYAKANARPATTQRYDLGALVLETGTSAGVIELRTAAQYDAAPKAPPPPGGWPSAVSDPSYWNNMSRIFHELKTELLHYFTRNAISGLTILQAPAVSSFTPSPPPGMPATPYGNSGWGTDRRACWVIFGHDAYFGWMPYDHTANALHETGHVVYGVHQYTSTTQVSVNTGATFDAHDYTDLCIMGYMKCDPDFCGRCVLSQAGWDTSRLSANPPGP
ncbi:MAG: OmpA family protein [Sandaracinaceae bacterium]|nr:OmpA family protein [Sandaracinaceae bacterium]